MAWKDDTLTSAVRYGMVLGALIVGLLALLVNSQASERVVTEITAGVVKCVAGTAQIALGKGEELYALTVSQGWKAMDGFLGTSIKTTGLVLIVSLGLGALSRWGALLAGLLVGGIGASIPIAVMDHLVKKEAGWLASVAQLLGGLGALGVGLFLFSIAYGPALEYLEEKLPDWWGQAAFWLAIPFILIVERSPDEIPDMMQGVSEADLLGILTLMLWARLFCGFYDKAMGRDYLGPILRNVQAWMGRIVQVRIGTVQFWLAVTLALGVFFAGKTMLVGSGAGLGKVVWSAATVGEYARLASWPLPTSAAVYALGMTVLLGSVGIVFLKPSLRFTGLLVLVAAFCEVTQWMFQWASSFSDRIDAEGGTEALLWGGTFGLTGLLIRDVSYGWHQVLLGIEKLNAPWHRGVARGLMGLSLMVVSVTFWPPSSLRVGSSAGMPESGWLAAAGYLVALLLLKKVTVSRLPSEPALFFWAVSGLLKPFGKIWSGLCEGIRAVQEARERERELKRSLEELEEIRKAREKALREAEENERRRREQEAREAKERARREAEERARRKEEERLRVEAYEQRIRDLHAAGLLWKRCRPELLWNWTCKECGTEVEAEGLHPTCIVCDQGIPLTEDIQPVCSQCDKRFCLKNGMPEETTELACGSEDYYRRTGKLPRSASGSE